MSTSLREKSKSSSASPRQGQSPAAAASSPGDQPQIVAVSPSLSLMVPQTYARVVNDRSQKVLTVVLGPSRPRR